MEANLQPKATKFHSGQSLAEAALFMPILLLLIVGVVEVSQMLITQNRISTAARNATRFGAQGGEDVGIRNITLNTVTQTLDLTSGMWDIFVVRGEFDEFGNLPPAFFSAEHIYGDGMTQAYTSTTTSEAWDDLRQEIVDRLTYSGTSPARLKVVGVLILHDINSILGLDLLPALMGRNTIRGFSIMRNSALATTVTQSTGCTGVYPLIVDVGTRSITRHLFDQLSFTYPNSPPSYNSFAGHVAEVELDAANEGYIFWLHVPPPGANITSGQTMGLLKWNPLQTGGGYLSESMKYPGNSSHPTLGFREWGDSNDREMQKGDRVARSSESLSAINSRLRNHIDTGRALRLPLWNQAAAGYEHNEGDSYFFISGFAIFRVRGYGSNWVLLELVGLDSSCGQS